MANLVPAEDAQMKAIVYANADGPAQVWLLDGDDVPPSAAIPGGAGGQARVMIYKGPALSWEEWGRELAASPWFGDWSVREVPDGMTDPHTALNYVRTQEIFQNAGGRATSS